MGALLKIVPDVRNVSDLPAALTADPWAVATEAQRRVADMRAAVVAPLAELVGGGASINNTAALFASRCAAGLLDANTMHVMQVLGAEAASVPTMKRWISAYRKTGKNGLLPQHTGRVRKDYGWETRAVALYNVPSKPGFADVAWTLRAEGHDSATESRVKRFLKALPATLGANSPARVGKHLHRLTRQNFQPRHTDNLLVGEVYAGDGHTVDCYVAHPNTGKPYRPELTAFIDVKSRYIAGWWFTESESAVSTLYALSSAMMGHDHVPAWLYIDRGAGYRAKMLSDENTGWYGKFGIGVVGALPGNPHGKGWIERWFRTMRDKHDKAFAGGQVYCGDDMAPEINRRLSAEINAGKRTLPSLHDYVASFRAFLERYHNEPKKVLGGRTPAQVWAELTPVAVGVDGDAVMRPSEAATVSRQRVRLHNRFYFHEALLHYDGHRLNVEYDLHNDGRVWVFDPKGRLVCEAKLVNTIGVLPTSRIEEGRDRRKAEQIKRLQRKVDEVTARREDAITADDQVKALADLSATDQLLPPLPGTPRLTSPAPAPAADVIDIDIRTWRKDQ